MVGINSQFNSLHIFFHISSCSIRFTGSFNMENKVKIVFHLIIHTFYIKHNNNLKIYSIIWTMR